MTTGNEALRLEKVVKTYGPTLALAAASFSVQSGHVHALLGENGAGKSTTVKLLSGLVRPTLGSIHIFGQPVQMARPTDAHKLGCRLRFRKSA